VVLKRATSSSAFLDKAIAFPCPTPIPHAHTCFCHRGARPACHSALKKWCCFFKIMLLVAFFFFSFRTIELLRFAGTVVACKRPNHIFFLWGQSVILWINLYGQLLLKFPNQAAGQRAMLAQSRQRQAGEPPPLLPSELFNNCRKGSAAPFASYHPQPNSLGAWLLQLLSYLNIYLGSIRTTFKKLVD
jgi:hypothetical protein